MQRTLGTARRSMLGLTMAIVAMMGAGPALAYDAEHAQVTSFDGVVLDGWVLHPDVPAGTRTPVVVRSTPYQGTVEGSLEDPNRDIAEPVGGDGVRNPMPIDRLLNEGYAVAQFNVRGSANSGGCFEAFGPSERRDQKVLVEWLADQAWSSGDVAMMGYSYDGMTQLEAAVQNPRGLRTILLGGIFPDVYSNMFATPQGAILSDFVPALGAALYGAYSQPPERTSPGAAPSALSYWPNVAPEHVCPGTAREFSSTTTFAIADHRDREFFEQRRVLDDMRKIRAAVLLFHGFQDHFVFGEDLAWQALRHAPKWQLEGQWGHRTPWHEGDLPYVWEDKVVEWLDYWLKGKGPEPAGLGHVDYRDAAGDWRRTSSWPPPEAREEVLKLAGDRLSPDPAATSRSFQSRPDTQLAGGFPNGARHDGEGYDGDGYTPCDALDSGLIYEKAVSKRTVIAGNPFAFLRITSDGDRGGFVLRLFRLDKNFSCQSGRTATDADTGFRFLSEGAIDLAFHGGNFDAKPFPVGEPSWVRVDIANLAEVIEPGQRLAAVVTFGSQESRLGQRGLPNITVHGNSELIVPVVEGTFDGRKVTREYPPRPFGLKANGQGRRCRSACKRRLAVRRRDRG